VQRAGFEEGFGSGSGDCKALLSVHLSSFLGLPLRLSGGSMADVGFGLLDDVRILRCGSQ